MVSMNASLSHKVDGKFPRKETLELAWKPCHRERFVRTIQPWNIECWRVPLIPKWMFMWQMSGFIEGLWPPNVAEIDSVVVPISWMANTKPITLIQHFRGAETLVGCWIISNINDSCRD